MSLPNPADLDFIFKDSGVPLQFTDPLGVLHETNGTIDEDDEDAASAEAATLAVHEIVVEFRTGALPATLAAGSTLTVDGTARRVTMLRQVGDGHVTRAWCARPS